MSVLPAVALSLVMGLASCATVVEAQVTTAPARPVAGAAVLMDCPQFLSGNGSSLFGKTDAEGVLRHRENPLGRWFGNHCDLVVEKDGFELKRVPVEQVCKKYHWTRCIHAVMAIELAPDRVYH